MPIFLALQKRLKIKSGHKEFRIHRTHKKILVPMENCSCRWEDRQPLVPLSRNMYHREAQLTTSESLEAVPGLAGAELSLCTLLPHPVTHRPVFGAYLGSLGS